MPVKDKKSAADTLQYGIAKAIAESFKKPTEADKAMTSIIKIQAAFNVLEEGVKLVKDEDNDIHSMNDYFDHLDSAAKHV